jgi:hypothetical protein
LPSSLRIVTTLPACPAAFIRPIMPSAPHMAVPVDPPTDRPSSRLVHRIAATDAASGTRIIASTTVPTNDGSTRGRPIPSIRDPQAPSPGAALPDQLSR